MGLKAMLGRRSVARLSRLTKQFLYERDFRQALAPARQAADVARRSLPTGSEEFIAAMSLLASVYASLHDDDRAEEILLETVHCDGFRNVDTAEAAAALNNLAVVCMRRGRLTDATLYMAEAIELKRKQCASDKTAYLGNLQDMIFCLGRLDRDREAIPYLRQMLDIVTSAVGASDAECAKAQQNLALALERAGERAEATHLRQLAAKTLGQSFDEKGEEDESIGADRKEATRDRQVEEVLELYRRGELKEALRIQRLIVSQLPQFPTVGFDAVIGNIFDPFLAKASNLDMDGLAAEDRGDLDEAATTFELVVAILKGSLDREHPQVRGALNNLAQIRRKQRRYDEAKRLFGEALDGLQSLSEKQSPKTIMAANVAAMYLDIAEEVAPTPSMDVVEASFEGKPADYAAGFRLRLPVPIEGESPVSNTMRWLEGRARFYQSLGVVEKVVFLYEHLIEMCGLVRGSRHRDLIEPLCALSRYEIEHAKYAEATKHVARAVAIAEATEEAAPELPALMRQQAVLMSSTGRGDAAEPLLARAIDLRRKSAMSDVEALAWEEDLAVLKLLNGRVDDLTRSILKKVLAANGRSKLEELDPSRIQGLASYAEILGDTERALELFDTACRRHQEAGEWTAPSALALSNYANALRSVGRREEAESRFRRAAEIRCAVLGVNHPARAETLIRLSIVLAALERPQDALAVATEALAIGARLVDQLSAISSDTSRLEIARRHYGHLSVPLSIVVKFFPDQDSAVRLAYELVLRRKAVAAQALYEQRNAILAGRYPQLQDQFRELEAFTAEIVRDAMTPCAPDDAAERELARAVAIEQKDALEATLAREVREINLEAPLSATTVEAVAAALPPDSVLVEFVDHHEINFSANSAKGDAEYLPRRYIAFILPAGRPEGLVLVDIGAADPIDALIRSEIIRLSHDCGSRDFSDDTAEDERGFGDADQSQTSFNQVLEPILERVADAKHLFLAPDGQLSLLPFDGLQLSDGRWLIDQHEINYLGSGRDALRFARASDRPVNSGSVVVTSPDFDLGLESCGGESNGSDVGSESTPKAKGWLKRQIGNCRPLPGTVEEGNAICGQLSDARLLIGRDAMVGTIRHVRRPRILHFATHGFFLRPAGADGNDGSSAMLRSGLVLAGANSWLKGRPAPPEAETGFLVAEDIATLDLIDTEVVVLSACETAVGHVFSGEGVFGLRRGFALAGARSIVMSLWKVPDTETKDLMILFYDNLLKGLSKPAALRAAKMSLKDKVGSPYYWGAFICEGDWHSLF